MKGYTIFLQGVIVLVGLGVLAFLLWEPHLEGRNVGATVFEIYFKDPFLAYIYIASIPFFVALSRIFKFLENVRNGNIFSEASVKAVQMVHKCALITAAAVAGALVYLFIASQSNQEDAAGVIMLGIIEIIFFLVMASVAKVWEHVLQNGIELSGK